MRFWVRSIRFYPISLCETHYVGEIKQNTLSDVLQAHAIQKSQPTRYGQNSEKQQAFSHPCSMHSVWQYHQGNCKAQSSNRWSKSVSLGKLFLNQKVTIKPIVDVGHSNILLQSKVLRQILKLVPSAHTTTLSATFVNTDKTSTDATQVLI